MNDKKEGVNNKNNEEDSLFVFLKGAVMGASDIIPGVSGGTMALITGVYERLIFSINKIKFSSPFRTFDFRFFVPLVLGIAMAAFLMANIIGYALNNFQPQTYALFFGLILASALFVSKKYLKKISYPILFSGLAGFIFAFIFVGLNPIENASGPLILFFSAILAISAMLLPGISGAFILVLLGQYDYLIKSIKNIQILEIIFFGFGAIIGVLAFSKLIGYLLRNRESLTMAFLVGLMLGALRMPYKKIVDAMSLSITQVLSVFITGIFGFVLVILLEKLSGHNLVSDSK